MMHMVLCNFIQEVMIAFKLFVLRTFDSIGITQMVSCNFIQEVMIVFSTSCFF